MTTPEATGPDLVGFLRERLDEVKATAQEACQGATGVWMVGRYGEVSYGDDLADWPDDDPGDGIVVYAEGKPSEGQARHIALHDPARVLREVEAKRRILALHQAIPAWPHGTVGANYYRTTRVCASCDERTAVPCPTLRLLALPYDQHPDYRTEWRP